MKIVFLDIDGVLLSTRAWALPENAEPERLARSGKLAKALRAVRFDPVAVALVNRLCSRSGAKLVCHSSWRATYGLQRSQRKLIEQGIEPGHLHSALCSTSGMQLEKARDIRLWLENNRVTPAPEWPRGIERYPLSRPYTRSEQRQIAQYHRDVANRGIDYLALDDHRLHDSVPQILVDPVEGLTVADYRVALGYFGGEDSRLGCYSVGEEDLAKVIDALGSRIEAAEWLHRTMRSKRLNEAWLRAEAAIQRAASLFMAGATLDADAFIAEVRNRVWAELPKARRRRS